jgi:hypothetical protein
MQKYPEIFRGPEPTENSKKNGKKIVGLFSYIKRNSFPSGDGQLHFKSISSCHPGAG